MLLPYAIDREKYYISMKNPFSFEVYPQANDELLKKLYEIWRIIELSIDELVLKHSKNIDYREYVQNRLLLLSKWAIIPIKFDNDKKIHLAPIDSLSLILLERTTTAITSRELKNLFGKLNLPFLARSDFPILRKIVVNLDDLKDLLNVFNFVCNNNGDLIKTLNNEERNNFLKYLIIKIKHLKNHKVE